jgi:hypothetical protein
MTQDQALKICRLLAEVYRRDEWSPERMEVWTALLIDLPFEATREALLGWARAEKWPPAPSELRSLVYDAQQANAERTRLTWASESRLALEAGPAKPLEVTQLHMWRASMGNPVPDCDCESCELGRQIVAR